MVERMAGLGGGESESDPGLGCAGKGRSNDRPNSNASNPNMWCMWSELIAKPASSLEAGGVGRGAGHANSSSSVGGGDGGDGGDASEIAG